MGMAIGGAPVRMRRLCSTIASVVLAGVVVMGCGDPETEDAGAGDQAEAARHLRPAGSELVHGFVVPAGTELVAAAFEEPRPPGAPGRPSDVAILHVNGNPFAAWDDFAEQAAKLGMPWPKSGICRWEIRDDTVSREPVAASEGQPDEWMALTCTAGAAAELEGELIFLEARLWLWEEGAELALAFSPGERTGSFWFPEGEHSPVPDDVARDVPQVERGDEPETGEKFGRENNCFEEGYARFRVPKGATVIGGGRTPALRDFAAVLRVEDAEGVLRDLGEQLDPTGPDEGDGFVSIEAVKTEAGEVWQLHGSVSAGGGSCAAWSSEDGQFVYVTSSSD